MTGWEDVHVPAVLLALRCANCHRLVATLDDAVGATWDDSGRRCACDWPAYPDPPAAKVAEGRRKLPTAKTGARAAATWRAQPGA